MESIRKMGVKKKIEAKISISYKIMGIIKKSENIIQNKPTFMDQ